jgi:3-oxoadipate enol-lactonase
MGPMPEPLRIPVAAAAVDGPAGAPVLVLGNSLGTSTAVWDRQVAEFRRHFRLVRYELPGHGGSPSGAGPYTIGGLGAGVPALADSLGVGRFAYCGILLGGMIGMWMAAAAPDRIAALGLVCTSAYLPPADGWRTRASQVRAAGMASVSAAVVGRWFSPAFAARAPAVIGEFRAELERTDPVGYAGCCEAIAEMDLRARLPAIAAPTLVLAGADDPATPPEHGADIARLVPDARLDVIPVTAHLATVEAADLVTGTLVSHLRAASGSTGGMGSEG